MVSYKKYYKETSDPFHNTKDISCTPDASKHFNEGYRIESRPFLGKPDLSILKDKDKKTAGRVSKTHPALWF